ncbi:MAG: hypothetical protein HY901_30575 [Deltaproteobacteria bacterium]|nr:hypothetical protein [Deltaproteobacteria bacterium]
MPVSSATSTTPISALKTQLKEEAELQALFYSTQVKTVDLCRQLGKELGAELIKNPAEAIDQILVYREVAGSKANQIALYQEDTRKLQKALAGSILPDKSNSEAVGVTLTRLNNLWSDRSVALTSDEPFPQSKAAESFFKPIIKQLSPEVAESLQIPGAPQYQSEQLEAM